MHPKNIKIAAYDYALPDELIAKEPLKKRDESQLLIWNNGTISTSQYKSIAACLPTKSLVCFNETKVINARLYFQKATGGKLEIFCLEPSKHYTDVTQAMLQTHKVIWTCLVGGASKWKNGEVIHCSTPTENLQLTARVHEKLSDGFDILFEWNTEHTFAEVLQQVGEIPLPPYLNRKPEESDYETYQTMFAKHEGSVAAPTASLHFTPQILASFASNNINTTQLTLHVGAGTFKPVKAEEMEHHEMHPEFIDVAQSTIETLLHQLQQKQPIIAVGTTSVRTLESLYWMGVLLHNNKPINLQEISITQWMPYELSITASPVESLLALIQYIQCNNLARLITRTQIIIAPGYTFKIVNGIVTNFHQPKSTLLLLISAFLGEEWRNMYQYAIAHNFRFLSYGDGCLLLRD